MPDNLALQPSLSDEAIRAIAELATRIEQHQEAPVDIEWAWQDGRIWLLQARPVTSRLL
jgi:pyruvate,water dikinase